MDSILRKDLEYVLPLLEAGDRVDPPSVLRAIEDFLPERKGAYQLSEIENALRKSA